MIVILFRKNKRKIDTCYIKFIRVDKGRFIIQFRINGFYYKISIKIGYVAQFINGGKKC